jgi:hypothetical protein
LINLKNINLKSIVSGAQLAYKTNKPGNITEVNIKDIAVRAIKIPLLLSDNIFKCKLVSLNDITLKVFRNGNVELDKTKTKKLLQEVLRDVNFKYAIDIVDITKGTIIFEALRKGAREAGRLELKDVSIAARNISNMPEIWADSYPMTINFSSRLFGTSPLDIFIKMPLNDPNCNHYLKLTIGAMHMPDLNMLLEDLVKISVQSGELKEGHAEVYADKFRSSANATYIYEGLKVNVIKENKSTKKVFTTIANMFVKNSNTGENGEKPRQSKIEFDRHMYKPFIAYWWETIAMTLLQTMAPDVYKQMQGGQKGKQEKSK